MLIERLLGRGRRSTSARRLPHETGRLDEVLIACERLVVAGGLLRFERFGRAFANAGGRLCWLVFDEGERADWVSDFPSLSFDEASRQRWDAVMIPGSGFGRPTIRRFARLRDARFGLRVQHVLNDEARKASFLKVNRIFEPDLVVFNNRHWSTESRAAFRHGAQAVLEGAVDLERFAPPPSRPLLASKDAIVIGALAKKNLPPVIEALTLLPERVRIHAIGPAPEEARRLAERRAPGRVRFLGPVADAALPDLYRSFDIVTHTELSAGWANVVAEAMASGAPVVATPAGALSLVEDGRTGLRIDAPPDPVRIAAQIRRLLDEPDLAPALAAAARAHVGRFGWDDYARRLKRICLGGSGGDVDDRQPSRALS